MNNQNQFTDDELGLLADALITRISELKERVELGHMLAHTTQWKTGCESLLSRIHDTLNAKNPELSEEIEHCPICHQPAHASETDDLNRHPSCRDSKPTLQNGDAL